MSDATLTALFVVDLHNRLAELELLPAADLLLIGGDFTTFGTPAQIAAAVRQAQQRFPRVLAVLGNCDPLAAEQTLQELGVALDQRSVAIGPALFIGNSGSNPTPAKTPYEWDDEGRGTLLAPLAAAARSGLATVLVSHAPPSQSGADRLPNGLQVGSRSVRKLMEALGCPLVLCGHIHEGEGLFPREDGGLTVNPGPFSHGKYARIVFQPGQPPRVELQRFRND